jgi:hypothetical protein
MVKAATLVLMLLFRTKAPISGQLLAAVRPCLSEIKEFVTGYAKEMTEQEQAGWWAEFVEEATRAVQGDAGLLDGIELHTKLAETSRRNEELAAENAKLADDATQLRRELEDLEQQNRTEQNRTKHSVVNVDCNVGELIEGKPGVRGTTKIAERTAANDN